MALSDDLPNIPSEIISNIFSRLPIKPLCRFRLVSKSWLPVINGFIMARPKSQKLIIASNTYPCSFYTLDFQSLNNHVETKNFYDCWFEILGSCNGILLLLSSYRTLFLWNPLTGKHRAIPLPGSSRHTVIQGLGYDNVGDDFKVVMVITHSGLPHPTYAYVFSSVSSTWKKIEDFRYGINSSAPGAVLNGSPHWVVGNYQVPQGIVYFDPCEDTFGQLDIPALGSPFSNFRLIVLGGDLCGVNDNKVSNSVDVWLMKGSAWSKLFVMSLGQGEFAARVYTPLCFVGGKEDFGDGFVVVQLNNQALALFNLKENRFERIQLPQDCERFRAACYLETLVSP